MKTKTLLIGAIAVGVMLAGGWALAQSAGPQRGFGPPFMHGHGSDGMGPGMMKGMRHGMGPGMMTGMGPAMMHKGPGSAFADAAQLETLKGELGITTAQEVAWNKYAKAVKDAAAARKTAQESVDPGVVSRMTPSERFAFVSKMREHGQKQLEGVRTAANELLAVLDEAQKAEAGDLLPGLAFGTMRGEIATDRHHRH
jgi:hypothetical protein